MRFVAALFMILMVVDPLNAFATFYKYKDENGSINLTNDYKSIPERYRSNVKVITENELEDRTNTSKKTKRPENTETPVTKRQSQVTQQEEPVQSLSPERSSTTQKETGNNDTWFSRQIPFLKLVGIVILIVAGLVVVGRLVTALAPRPLAVAIRFALFAAIAVYLFKNHAEKITKAFASIKSDSEVVQKAVDKRSEKIEQQAQ